MANIKEAFEYAAQNPDSDFATKLQQLAGSGALDAEAKKYNIDLSVFRSEPNKKVTQVVKEVAQEVIRPAERIGAGVMNIAGAGINKAGKVLGGDGIQELKPEPTRTGLLGNEVDTLGFRGGERLKGADLAKDIVGALLEGASYALPVGAAKQAASSVLKTAGLGAAAGQAMGMGEELQKGQDIVDSFVAALPQAGLGAATGGALSAVTKGAPVAVSAATKGLRKTAEALTPDSAAIMQRVARISKPKQAKFKDASQGESVGDYLVNRGIFGDDEQIVEQLYKRFNDSKRVADESLASLKGTYQPRQVRDALEMLSEKFTKASTKGAQDPNLARTNELISKLDTDGLSMSEINEAKRLFERNVKLDFLKENSTDGVRKANNIDNSIREWQVSKAEELGLKNLPQINRETRLARQLMDDLGAESAGVAGNNAVSLTDWIVLAEGNPASIAAFLGKKAASSKKIQSAVAKKFAPKPTVGSPKAEFSN